MFLVSNVRPVSSVLAAITASGKEHVRPDHVHLLLSVPPHLAPSRVRQAMKGQSSHSLLPERRRLRQEFWGQHLWARGSFVCSSGNVTDERIAAYLRTQGAEPQDDERFKISE